MRDLAIFFVSVASWISPLSAQTDLVRDNELQMRMLVERVAENTRQLQSQEAIQHRQFAVKFNQLAEAVASFAMEYNKGKGSVWPKREADKLRKALRELESVEKSLR